MRDYNSIFNRVPSDHCIVGGMCVPIGLLTNSKTKNNDKGRKRLSVR